MDSLGVPVSPYGGAQGKHVALLIRLRIATLISLCLVGLRTCRLARQPEVADARDNALREARAKAKPPVDWQIGLGPSRAPASKATAARGSLRSALATIRSKALWTSRRATSILLSAGMRHSGYRRGGRSRVSPFQPET